MVFSNGLELSGSLIRNLSKPEVVAALESYPNALGGANLTAQVLRGNLFEARANELRDEERLDSGVLISTITVAQLKSAIRPLTWMTRSMGINRNCELYVLF